jgi:hypothetical protein
MSQQSPPRATKAPTDSGVKGGVFTPQAMVGPELPKLSPSMSVNHGVQAPLAQSPGPVQMSPSKKPQPPAPCVKPSGQSQSPLKQASPPHELLQEPQLAGSLCVSTQASPQRSSGALHTIAHSLSAHDALPLSGAGQATLQPPQFCTSLVVTTQAPLQLVVPTAHESAQVPPEHTLPAEHAWPQAPQ